MGSNPARDNEKGKRKKGKNIYINLQRVHIRPSNSTFNKSNVLPYNDTLNHCVWQVIQSQDFF